MGSDRMPRKPFIQTVVVHKHIRNQYRETKFEKVCIYLGVGGGGGYGGRGGDGVSQ